MDDDASCDLFRRAQSFESTNMRIVFIGQLPKFRDGTTQHRLKSQDFSDVCLKNQTSIIKSILQQI